jgi:hypothetical protein
MRSGIVVAAVLLAGVLASGLGAAGDSGNELTKRFGGRWVGSYTGDDSGTVTIVLSPGTDGNHKGTLTAASSSGQNYAATFKVLTLDGTHMVAKYDVASGEGALDGDFDEESAAGTWSYHDANGTSSSGTWKVTREAQD